MLRLLCKLSWVRWRKGFVNKYGLIAKLVWDGGDSLRIPEEMGTPAPNQMQGTVYEQLCEIGGRICYDSLGKGRSSLDFHKHILDVGHLSVDEHPHVTIQIHTGFQLHVFLNRPDFWVTLEPGTTRVTMNPRGIYEWDLWSRIISPEAPDLVGIPGSVGDQLSYHAEKLFPQIVAPRERKPEVVRQYEAWTKVVPPRTDEEKWVTMFVGGSRGFSHELVRHGNFTGISQRSTRFVSEDESPWVDHPLIQEFWASTDPVPDDPAAKGATKALAEETKRVARETYSRVSAALQKWLLARGVEKLTARKQARGAARGYLGNALWTELIFSASVGQWKRMMRMRCCDPADAEIRSVFVDALRELKASRYGKDFENFELVPASDKVGQAAVERKGTA